MNAAIWVACGVAVGWIVALTMRKGASIATGAVTLSDLEKQLSHLSPIERRVFSQYAQRKPVSGDLMKGYDAAGTFGERLADRVATLGGSWGFIMNFIAVLVAWMIFNVRESKPFDPYPFILLNLVLSCLAALQAPVIMMSQNRQAAKDRLDAQNDYQVNLKAEMEILGLHSKLDEARERDLRQVIELQQQQIQLLESVLKKGGKP